jgi:hypothetical protein
MKPQLTATVAAAISFVLNSVSVTAGAPQFRVPLTARAQESAELLTRTAHAFYASRSISALSARGMQVKSLWLYPTGDADTVFAQYTLRSEEGGDSPTEHLALLTVWKDRIVQLRELSEQRYATNERPSTRAHWAAAIGNGHTSDATADSGSARGVPALPDWTAAIGTGRATPSTNAENELPGEPQHFIADAHWTSKIGTGHSSESNVRPTESASAVVSKTRSTSPALGRSE